MSNNAERYQGKNKGEPNTLRVHFTRVGRSSRKVADLVVELNEVTTDNIARAVYKYARRYLMSQHFDVNVDRKAGKVYLGGGRYGEGEFTVDGEQPSEDEGSYDSDKEEFESLPR